MPISSEGLSMKEVFGYKVLEDGTVLSKRNGSPLKWSNNGKGYMVSAIHVEGKRIAISHHQLVALAYYGECPKGYEVGHKDDDRTNNHPDNLSYVTKSQNNQQSYDNGNRSAVGFNNANCKISEQTIIKICEALNSSTKLNISKLARGLGVSRGTINSIRSGRQWSHITYRYLNQRSQTTEKQ
jgi:hypothetical protein